MNELEPFGPEVIERFLTTHNIRYFRDSGNGFFAIFEPSGPNDDEIQLSFRVEGSASDLYAIRATTATYYPPEEWPQLLALVNQWNAERRYPKVYLQFRPGKGIATLVAEGQIDCEGGVHQAFLDRFSMIIVHCAFQFFRWLGENRVAPPTSGSGPSADELETWFRQAS